MDTNREQRLPDCGAEDFCALVDEYYARVYYHALKLVKNGHDAADITQNTFTKAFVFCRRLHQPASFGAWIFTVCNNEIRQLKKNHPNPRFNPRRRNPKRITRSSTGLLTHWRRSIKT